MIQAAVGDGWIDPVIGASPYEGSTEVVKLPMLEEICPISDTGLETTEAIKRAIRFGAERVTGAEHIVIRSYCAGNRARGSDLEDGVVCQRHRIATCCLGSFWRQGPDTIFEINLTKAQAADLTATLRGEDHQPHQGPTDSIFTLCRYPYLGELGEGEVALTFPVLGRLDVG